jgi:hypothetical protein
MNRRPRDDKKHRGVFEKEPGSGIWWIRYFADGQKKREKVGRKSDAIALYQKRKADVRVGLKLPDNMHQRAVVIMELGREAIQWYKDHSKRDLYTFSNGSYLVYVRLSAGAPPDKPWTWEVAVQVELQPEDQPVRYQQRLYS